MRGSAVLPMVAAALVSCGPDAPTLRMGLSRAEHDRCCFPTSEAHPNTGSHAGFSCADCHGDGETFAQNRCAECHASLTSGLSPYQRHRDVGGFVVGTPACKNCHAENQLDRVNAHPRFLVRAGAPHHLAPCLDCHRAAREDKPWAADFSRHDCRACHAVLDMAAAHGDVVDYVAYDQPRCASCHEDGSAP